MREDDGTYNHSHEELVRKPMRIAETDGSSCSPCFCRIKKFDRGSPPALKPFPAAVLEPGRAAQTCASRSCSTYLLALGPPAPAGPPEASCYRMKTLARGSARPQSDYPKRSGPEDIEAAEGSLQVARQEKAPAEPVVTGAAALLSELRQARFASAACFEIRPSSSWSDMCSAPLLTLAFHQRGRTKPLGRTGQEASACHPELVHDGPAHALAGQSTSQETQVSHEASALCARQGVGCYLSDEPLSCATHPATLHRCWRKLK
mmetsp:Transcript_123598/g.395367  ORF Transcript_123598/g.395367 Transcript_123598/m.395367 type:complete len:262 (-) Transcript_123598:957-1742(-)